MSSDEGPWSEVVRDLDGKCCRPNNRSCRRTGGRAADDAGENPWQGLQQLQEEQLADDPWADVHQLPVQGTNVGSGTVSLGAGGVELTLGRGAVAAAAQQGHRTKYQLNGMAADKVRQRWATGGCTCTKVKRGCHRAIPVKDLQCVCELYWAMSDEERSLLIRTCYLAAVRGDARSAIEDSGYAEELADDETTKKTAKWVLCGVPVCYSNFVYLLGTSSRTISKQIQGVPDLRKSVKGAPGIVRAAPQARHVDFFFYELYHSAAEPLPDPSSSSSTTAKADVLLNGSPWLDLQEEQVPEWTPDNPSIETFVQLTVACQGVATPGVPVRYLQHGRLHDLYWLFLAQWDLVSVQGQEPEECVVPPSYTLFWRRWQVWKRFLRFRKSSQHAQCQTCWELHQRMHKHNNTWHNRLEAARALRVHYHNQYLDRCIYWSLRFASRSFWDVLCIIIDTVDKAKFAWPRWGYGRVSKKMENLHRPRTVLTAAMAHGYGTYLFMADEIQSHGSDAFCEVLSGAQFQCLL